MLANPNWLPPDSAALIIPPFTSQSGKSQLSKAPWLFWALFLPKTSIDWLWAKVMFMPYSTSRPTQMNTLPGHSSGNLSLFSNVRLFWAYPLTWSLQKRMNCGDIRPQARFIICPCSQAYVWDYNVFHAFQWQYPLLSSRWPWQWSALQNSATRKVPLPEICRCVYAPTMHLHKQVPYIFYCQACIQAISPQKAWRICCQTVLTVRGQQAIYIF